VRALCLYEGQLCQRPSLSGQAAIEFSCKFAPYVSAIYERKLGGTARLARADGEDPGGWSIRGSVRIWF
jgi:copper resistance protein B